MSELVCRGTLFSFDGDSVVETLTIFEIGNEKWSGLMYNPTTKMITRIHGKEAVDAWGQIQDALGRRVELATGEVWGG